MLHYVENPLELSDRRKSTNQMTQGSKKQKAVWGPPEMKIPGEQLRPMKEKSNNVSKVSNPEPPKGCDPPTPEAAVPKTTEGPVSIRDG